MHDFPSGLEIDARAVLAGALAIVALTFGGFIAWRRESPVMRSPALLTGLAVGYALSIPLNEPANAVRFDYHIHKSHFISSFFISEVRTSALLMTYLMSAS